MRGSVGRVKHDLQMVVQLLDRAVSDQGRRVASKQDGLKAELGGTFAVNAPVRLRVQFVHVKVLRLFIANHEAA